MSPEAFSAILEARRGKGTISFPTADDDESVTIDPEKTMLACEHPDFTALADTEDAPYLWLCTEGPVNVKLGPIKFRFDEDTKLIDVRTISVLFFE